MYKRQIVYCPSTTIKVFRFVGELISSGSKRTIIQTFVNFFQSRVMKEEGALLTMTNKLFKVLASTLDLQYGNIMLATTSNEKRKDLPFFADYSDMFGKCAHCDANKDIFKELGITFFCKYFFFK